MYNTLPNFNLKDIKNEIYTIDLLKPDRKKISFEQKMTDPIPQNCCINPISSN